jgi:hypothetical protein
MCQGNRESHNKLINSILQRLLKSIFWAFARKSQGRARGRAQIAGGFGNEGLAVEKTRSSLQLAKINHPAWRVTSA